MCLSADSRVDLWNFEQLICKSQLSCYGLVNISSTDPNSIQSLIQLKHEILQTLLSEVQRGIDYFNQWGETSQLLWEHLIYQIRILQAEHWTCLDLTWFSGSINSKNENYLTHIKTLSKSKTLGIENDYYVKKKSSSLFLKLTLIILTSVCWKHNSALDSK